MGKAKNYSGLFHETGKEYSEAFKAELDCRYAAYKNGTVEIITAEESKRRIAELMKQLKSKAS